MLGHEFGRDQPHDKRNSQRHDDDIVQIPKHRDEVGYQVNRRRGLSGHGQRQRQRLGVPRRAEITGRQIDGDGVAFEGLRPIFQAQPPADLPT